MNKVLLCFETSSLFWQFSKTKKKKKKKKKHFLTVMRITY